MKLFSSMSIAGNTETEESCVSKDWKISWQPCSGAGYFVFKVFKVNSQTFILLWCKKCEKLEKEVIFVQRSVSTINVCKKNEQNRPILSENDKKTEN